MATEKKVTSKKAVVKEAAAPVEEVKATEVVETPKAKKPTVKKAKAVAKEEPKKVEKPKKPTPTEAQAISKNVRVTPRKVRLVIDLVRGKDVKVALGILANVNRAASEPVIKTIKSAAANATNNFGMDADRLFISEIYACDGLRMKRFLPRAKGSASGLVKRSSHITVVVKMK